MGNNKKIPKAYQVGRWGGIYDERSGRCVGVKRIHLPLRVQIGTVRDEKRGK